MKTNFIVITLLSIFVLMLASCARDSEPKKDTSELYSKSQTRGAIIERSGTMLQAGSDPTAKKNQLRDAENRLQSGGGLFGKKGGIEFLNSNKEKTTTTASIGMPINPYLWRGSLEVIDFMPLSSADPFAGTIITDWYSIAESPNERCKINVFIKGAELQTNNLTVNTFCQYLNNDWVWLDSGSNAENNLKLENAILNKAKKIRISQN